MDFFHDRVMRASGITALVLVYTLIQYLNNGTSLMFIIGATALLGSVIFLVNEVKKDWKS